MRRALTGALLAFLVACGGGGGPAAPLGVAASAIPVPNKIGGLSISVEKDATKSLSDAVSQLVKSGQEPYPSDLIAYSLRKGKELKGVLQIMRFRPDARPEEASWRRDIVAQIGKGAVANPVKVGDAQVYKREGLKQEINVWFVQNYMYVLIIRQDETLENEGLGFDPEVLLEDAIAIRPA